MRDSDGELLHTPDGEVGPLGRGFRSATNQEDFRPRVVGFRHWHDAEWSDELRLTKLPETVTRTLRVAEAQVARWQSEHGF